MRTAGCVAVEGRVAESKQKRVVVCLVMAFLIQRMAHWSAAKTKVDWKSSILWVLCNPYHTVDSFGCNHVYSAGLCQYLLLSPLVPCFSQQWSLKPRVGTRAAVDASCKPNKPPAKTKKKTLELLAPSTILVLTCLG